MDMWLLLRYLIELLIVLLPVGTFFYKVSGWKAKLDNDISMLWKEVGALSAKVENNETVVGAIEKRLESIDTKLDLILQGKLKL